MVLPITGAFADLPDPRLDRNQLHAQTDIPTIALVEGRAASTAHYYVTSYRGSAAELGRLIRGHRGIENQRPWTLDVAFREDESRTSAGHAGANLGMLRRVAVSLLKRAADHGSIQLRRMRAAWDDAFLLRVLQGIPAV